MLCRGIVTVEIHKFLCWRPGTRVSLMDISNSKVQTDKGSKSALGDFVKYLSVTTLTVRIMDAENCLCTYSSYLATYLHCMTTNTEHTRPVFDNRSTLPFCCVFRFITSYSASDYPLSFKLRQLMFFQAKVQSKDKRLSILAEKCLATPTSDHKNSKKHFIMDNG